MKDSIKRRHKNTLNISKRNIPREHKFSGGSMMTKMSNKAANNAFSTENLGSSLGTIGGAVTTMADSMMKNMEIADTTGIENGIQSTASTNFSGAGDYDSLLGQWGGINWQDSDYTRQDVRGVSGGEMAMNTINSIGSGASAGASVGGPWGAIAGAALGLGTSLAGIFTGNKKAQDKADLLNLQAEAANQRAQANFSNQAFNINQMNKNRMMSSVAAMGGKLNKGIHGGDFSNGLTYVDNGGTHEQNPYEGVPMGLASDGQPNLVEEGEVIYNDYVFSNRLSLKENELKKAKLPSRYKNMTFALAAEDMAKESEERPLDSISKRGLEDSLSKLANIQEIQRMKKGKRGTQQMMAFGGRKYSSTEPLDVDTITNEIYNSIDPTKIDKISDLPIDTSSKPVFIPFMNKKGKVRNRGVWMDDRGNVIGRRNQNPHDKESSLNTYLRYAPALGAGIGALSSIFTKPDYSNSDLILEDVNNLSRNTVKPRLLGNYLTYNPLDRDYYLNQLRSQAAANRAAIMNSGSNAGQAMAGLLASDYNTMNSIGNTLMQMEQYNDAQKQRIAEFNRGTNQYNSQILMSADAQNAQLAQTRDQMRLNGIIQTANMREMTDTGLANARSLGLTNMFDNLGDIGRENFIMNQINTNPRWASEYKDFKGTIGHKDHNGGMLTKRNRRRK